jgi:hypothetical protein
MAKLTIEHKIILELTPDESNYLRNMLQNDITGGETEEQTELRRAIFEELPFPSVIGKKY